MPLIIVLAGPNGAGKTTAAEELLPTGIVFLNADEIAKTLPGYPSPSVDVQAGRQLLEAMDSLERNRAGFAVETTLASKTLAHRLRRMKAGGYLIRLIFLWTPNPEFSIKRVAERVRTGGHGIPEQTIRRRYFAGLSNLHRTYLPLVDLWEVYENTSLVGNRLVARGGAGQPIDVVNPFVWAALTEQADHERSEPRRA
jgi:predicted ABC-type ATPase